MSNLAANPAAVPDTVLRMMTRTNQSLCARNEGGGLRSSICSSANKMARANRAAMAANFIDQGADETLLRHVSADLYPAFVSVTASGLFMRPAAARSSASFAVANALRVTVSLQILFGKYTEKISPDPP